MRLSAVSEPARDVFRLSGASEGAREPVRLVGAESDERLAGIVGGKSMVRTDCEELSDSDMVLLLTGRRSKYSGSLYFDELESGADVNDVLRFVFRLLVDLSDCALEDLTEDCRSGITTTGIPPSFKICLRDLLLDCVLTVVLDVML